MAAILNRKGKNDLPEEGQQVLILLEQEESFDVPIVFHFVDTPAGAVAVHASLGGCGLQAGVCPDPEAAGQHRAAALVRQQDGRAPDGQPGEVALVPPRQGPQAQGLHQGLILLQLVGSQIHLHRGDCSGSEPQVH